MDWPKAQYILPGTDSQSHYLAKYYFTKALRPSNIRTRRMSNKILLEATIILRNTTWHCSVSTFMITFHSNLYFCKRSFTGSSAKNQNFHRKSQKSFKNVLFQIFTIGRNFREKGIPEDKNLSKTRFFYVIKEVFSKGSNNWIYIPPPPLSWYLRQGRDHFRKKIKQEAKGVCDLLPLWHWY